MPSKDLASLAREVEQLWGLDSPANSPPGSGIPEHQGSFLSGSKADNKLAQKVLIEYTRRLKEGLAIFEPLPAAIPFHQCTASRRIAGGPNRGGKTQAAAVEVAWLVTGQHPWHKTFPNKGEAIIVGKDESHLAMPLWKKLAFPGQFYCMNDGGLPRAIRLNPDDPTMLHPDDEARRDEWLPGPPLLGTRFLNMNKVSWKDKKKGIPGYIKLRNGFEISFYPGGSPPRSGVALDLIWFDEEINNELWYPECMARMVDKWWAKFIWSATPEHATEHFLSLHERCQEGSAEHKEFFFDLFSNPYLPAKTRQEFADSLTEDEKQAKVYGVYIASSLKVYPDFSMDHHGIDPMPIPIEWNRWISIDPGVKQTSILFWAIPPDNGPHAGEVHLYDSLIIKDAHAEKIAERLARKTRVQPILEGWICDWRRGRQRTEQTGKTIAEILQLSFEKHQVHFHNAMPIWGQDDTEAREEAFRSLMRTDANGQVRLKVHRGKATNLETEISRCFNDIKTGKRKDKGRNDHSIDAAEYFSAYILDKGDEPYIKHKHKPLFYDAVLDLWKRKKKKRNKGNQQTYNIG